MARIGQRGRSDSRSGFSFGVLTDVFPLEVVGQVLDDTERWEQRSRLLTSDVAVYFCLAMCLWADDSYIELSAKFTEALVAGGMWDPHQSRPTDAAIIKARKRLGHEPIAALFRSIARPLATTRTKGAWYKHWRLTAIDGTVLDVPDTPENVKAFSRPGAGRGEAAFPQIRVVGLVEIGTHAIFDAEVDGRNVSEVSLAHHLVQRLEPGTLNIADRGFFSFALWRKAAETGADLLWRMKSSAVLAPIETLPDGSYLSHVFSSDDKKKTDAQLVRVVEYSLGPDSPGPYRLLTTILDHRIRSAKELAGLYNERWEIEGGIGEIKTFQRGAGVVLRTKDPEGVRQEVWSHLCVHLALRTTMADVAANKDIDPDRMSFVNTLKIIRRTMTKAISCAAIFMANIAEEMLERALPERRNRSYPRVVKRKCRTSGSSVATGTNRSFHCLAALQSWGRRNQGRYAP